MAKLPRTSLQACPAPVTAIDDCPFSANEYRTAFANFPVLKREPGETPKLSSHSLPFPAKESVTELGSSCEATSVPENLIVVPPVMNSPSEPLISTVPLSLFSTAGEAAAAETQHFSAMGADPVNSVTSPLSLAYESSVSFQSAVGEALEIAGVVFESRAFFVHVAS
jgi:hypothetical protein